MNFWVSWPASSSPPDRRNIVVDYHEHHDYHDRHDHHPHWLEDREENIDGWGSPSHLLSSTHPLCLCSANIIAIITNITITTPSESVRLHHYHHEHARHYCKHHSYLHFYHHHHQVFNEHCSVVKKNIIWSYYWTKFNFTCLCFFASSLVWVSLESTFRPPSAPLPPFVCLRLQEIV